MDDPFDLENLKLPEDMVGVRVTPRKIAIRRKQFVQVPWGLVETLLGASSCTWYVAMYLAHLHWKSGNVTVKLANGMLQEDGVSRASKWRALAELERRGLVTIERKNGKSPVVTLGTVLQT